MRRPAKTKAQRAYERTDRALARLVRCAVRYSMAGDGEAELLPLAFADLTAACDKVRETLSPRELRRVLK